MPQTEKQRRFFSVVHAVQSGEQSPASVSRKVRKVARSMSPTDVNDFAKSVAEGKLTLEEKMNLLSILKSINKPSILREDQKNPVANEFTKKGDYDEFIGKFRGFPFSQRELDSVNNFKETSPTKIERDKIVYSTSDTFKNNTLTTILKLKEGGKYVYTAFTKFSQAGKAKEEPAAPEPTTSEPGVTGSVQPETPPEKEQEEIVITKSIAFGEDNEGAQTLSDFLMKIDL